MIDIFSHFSYMCMTILCSTGKIWVSTSWKQDWFFLSKLLPTATTTPAMSESWRSCILSLLGFLLPWCCVRVVQIIILLVFSDVSHHDMSRTTFHHIPPDGLSLQSFCLLSKGDFSQHWFMKLIQVLLQGLSTLKFYVDSIYKYCFF